MIRDEIPYSFTWIVSIGCKNQSSKQKIISDLEKEIVIQFQDTKSDLENVNVIQPQDTIEEIKIIDDYKLLFQRLSSQTYIQARSFAEEYSDEYKITNAVYGLSLLTDNSDTINVIIDCWLSNYYEIKGITKETNTINEYNQRSNIVNKFIINMDQMEEVQDIVCYYKISSIYENYLCKYYLDKLVLFPKNYKLENAIEKEIEAWNKFYDSQSETLRVFISDIGSGVTRASTFLSFKTSFYSKMKQSVLDLYWALTNQNHEIRKRFVPISQMYFENEYQLTSNLMQDSTMFYDNFYSSDQRIKIVQQEKRDWYELMRSRNKVSQHLTNHIKFVYDNATYRLQKQHLVEIKNEFGEYGVTSSEYQKFLLTDSCSYEKLLKDKRPREIFLGK